MSYKSGNKLGNLNSSEAFELLCLCKKCVLILRYIKHNKYLQVNRTILNVCVSHVHVVM